LEDDGDYFTWTLDELRAALSSQESRVMEFYFDVEAHGEMHHNRAKNVLWVARQPEEVASQLGLSETDVRLMIARAKGKLLAVRRARPTPTVDTTLYVSWNAMFCSAYLEAARVLSRDDCRTFALKTLNRILEDAWNQEKGFAHRVGGERLDGSLDDQVFAAAALLDAYEATLDPRYFRAAERAMDLAIARYGDSEGGGFFDRAKNALPLGGLDVRRKPLQDSPTPSGNSIAAIVLERLAALTGNSQYHRWAEVTLEAFAGVAPQYGLFAATYGLAATLLARHPLQVVVTGRADDPQARALEDFAAGVYRLGKALLRITPETPPDALSPALREILPGLRPDVPQALVCSSSACQPPTSDTAALLELLTPSVTGAAAH
ncbi:MAG: hypothetical protein ACREUP_10135, partial [Burkholderiales bacterium]